MDFIREMAAASSLSELYQVMARDIDLAPLLGEVQPLTKPFSSKNPKVGMAFLGIREEDGTEYIFFKPYKFD